VLKKKTLSPRKFSEDLGADSLDLVELIMAIEENFSTPDHKVEIPIRKRKDPAVQDAVDYIKKLGSRMLTGMIRLFIRLVQYISPL